MSPLKAFSAVQGASKSAATSNMLHGQLADLGDSELLLAGLHEHALSLRYMDTHMLTTEVQYVLAESIHCSAGRQQERYSQRQAARAAGRPWRL